MMITIDPNEMVTAATTLHNCAVEAADIGSQLTSSAAQAMPADLQYVVDQMVTTVDRALDAVAMRLDARAADLNARAQIAVNDSVAAAAAAGTPATFAVANANGWSVDAGAWMDPMSANVSAGFAVGTGSWMGGVSGDGAGGGLGVGTGSWMGGVSGDGAGGGLGVGTGSWMGGVSGDGAGGGLGVGTGSWLNSLPAPTTDGIVFQGVDRTGWMNSIRGGGATSSNPNGLIDAITAGTNNTTNRTIGRLIGSNEGIAGRFDAPSRLDLNQRAGHELTDGDIALISPLTLGSPGSQI